MECVALPFRIVNIESLKTWGSFALKYKRSSTSTGFVDEVDATVATVSRNIPFNPTYDACFLSSVSYFQYVQGVYKWMYSPLSIPCPRRIFVRHGYVF